MHDSRYSNQNLGNRLGSRPCVRLTGTYRKYESGNDAKALLGHQALQWGDHHYDKSAKKLQVTSREYASAAWSTSSSVIGAKHNN